MGRFTVSVMWVDGKAEASLVSVVVDANSPAQAARVALAKNFPRHNEALVYSWQMAMGQVMKFRRAERGKVQEVK